MKKTKSLGQVYTPDWIVRTILDEAAYLGTAIIGKTVLEPACGDGAFLIEIVCRYIEAAKQLGFSAEQIAVDLQTHIYGFEKDDMAHQQCLNRLNDVIKTQLGMANLNWQIEHVDTLQQYANYPQYFDFVFGNPPYIRIHNLDNATRCSIKKKLRFSSGIIDIYVSFFEMGLHMLKPNGVLGFITPNSFLHNTSYRDFRLFLQEKGHIKMLCDFKAQKVFEGFATYTAITIIDQTKKRNQFVYKEKNSQFNRIEEKNRIAFADLNQQKWILTNRENSVFLKKLFVDTNIYLHELFDIQYGLCTLRDKIYIAQAGNETAENIQFNGHWLERGILRKIVKAMRYKGDEKEMEYVLFPYYEKNGRYHAYSETELMQQFPLAYCYLLDNKAELLKRDLEKGAVWYEFGRSQGIQTLHKPKIAISSIIKQTFSCFRLPEDILVYSGIFLSAKYREDDLLLAEKILHSEDFFRYLCLTGKNLSGGYHAISSKQIQNYRIHYSKLDTHDLKAT